MTFEKALKAMREGKRVKRPCYSVEYFINGSNIKYIQKIDGKEYDFGGANAINGEDIMSNDWEVVDD